MNIDSAIDNDTPLAASNINAFASENTRLTTLLRATQMDNHADNGLTAFDFEILNNLLLDIEIKRVSGFCFKVILEW